MKTLRKNRRIFLAEYALKKEWNNLLMLQTKKGVFSDRFLQDNTAVVQQRIELLKTHLPEGRCQMILDELGHKNNK